MNVLVEPERQLAQEALGGHLLAEPGRYRANEALAANTSFFSFFFFRGQNTEPARRQLP
jgi:hypothetical protein